MRDSCRARLLLVACVALCGAGCSWSRGAQLPTAGLWDRMRPPFARKSTENAAKDLKDPGRLYLAYAKWQEQVGQLVEARESYETALIKNPKSVDAILGLSRLDHLAGRNREAEAGFKKALQLKPNDAHVLASLGQYYATNERYTEAIGTLRSAVEAAPQDPKYRFYLATALARSGDLGGAFPHFAHSVGEAAAHYNIGYLLYESEQLAAAEHEFLQAATLQPQLAEAQQMLVAVRQKRNKDVMLTEGPSTQPAPQTRHAVSEQVPERSWPVEAAAQVASQPTSAGPQGHAYSGRHSPSPASPQNPFAANDPFAATPPGPTAAIGTVTPRNPFTSGFAAPDGRADAAVPSTPTSSVPRQSAIVNRSNAEQSSGYRAVGSFPVHFGNQAPSTEAEVRNPFSDWDPRRSSNSQGLTPQQWEQLQNQINAGTVPGR